MLWFRLQLIPCKLVFEMSSIVYRIVFWSQQRMDVQQRLVTRNRCCNSKLNLKRFSFQMSKQIFTHFTEIKKVFEEHQKCYVRLIIRSNSILRNRLWKTLHSALDDHLLHKYTGYNEQIWSVPSCML